MAIKTFAACLRRYVTRTSAQRSLSINSIPDNAPSIKENEKWLKSLQGLQHERDPSVETKQNTDRLNSFPIEIAGHDEKYTHVKAPLINFIPLQYLSQWNPNRHPQMNFVDLKVVKCKSGRGGSGAVSFFRDTGRSIGPPDGGDGGQGGGIYVQAIQGISSLAKLKSSYVAQDGFKGASDQLDGSKGRDVLIEVPVGTVVRWCMAPHVIRQYISNRISDPSCADLRAVLSGIKVRLPCVREPYANPASLQIQLFRQSYKSGMGWIFKDKNSEYHNTKKWFTDLNNRVRDYDRGIRKSEYLSDRFPLFGKDFDVPTRNPFCLLKGGSGGLGNMHFLTNVIRNPRFAKLGRSGLEQYFTFELKSIADVGLVGLPNAGKSTILNKISNAKPKIGHWEFTTLVPTIGTISMGIGERSFTVADIPGIIKDASLNKGLGLEFIRHIERSKGLAFVVSLANQDPLEDLHTLVTELGGSQNVGEKNVLVICNKADYDCESPKSKAKYIQVANYCDSRGWDYLPISALKGENIESLLKKLAICSGVM